MDDDIHQLGEELVTTAARVIRWAPTDGFTMSLAAARLLARLFDNGPTRISDLATQERSSQPTITNHVKRLEAAGLVARATDPSDLRAWMIDLTPAGHDQLRQLRQRLGTNVEPYLARLSKRDIKALREGLEVMRRLVAADKLPK
jgi:DNA-binding MarR family transcriptional regulator